MGSKDAQLGGGAAFLPDQSVFAALRNLRPVEPADGFSYGN
jgi:hypothetical protein